MNLSAKAFAKINIGLHVLNKRRDGYHNIDSIFHRIAWHDRITIEDADDLILTVSDSSLPTGKHNTCRKAAQAFFESFGETPKCAIHIEKDIPVGAGLGGGSADAAVVLSLLNSMRETPLPPTRLRKLAASIGADVSFFLQGSSARVRGTGDIIDPIRIDIPYSILTVWPGIKIDTAWAYSALGYDLNQSREPLPENITDLLSAPRELQRRVRNEFEPVMFSTYPAIRDLKESLLDHGAVFALMSGSGSSVFGWFEHAVDAEKTIATLPGGYRFNLTPPHFQPGAIE